MMMWMGLLCGVALAAEPVEEEVLAPPGPDRSAPPVVLPASVLDQPAPKIHKLWPGMEAWHVRVPGVRKVVVQVVGRQGALELLGKDDGTGEAVGWLMDTATRGHSATQLEILGDLYEIQLTSSLNLHQGSVSLTVPRQDLGLGLELLGEVLKEPKYASRDLKLYQREQRVWVELTAPSSLRAVSSSALTHAWYPADHVYGTRTDLDGVLSLKSRELKQLHRGWMLDTPMVVLVVGDVAWRDVVSDLRAALKGAGSPGGISEEVPFTAPAGQRVFAVDLPEQEQASIRLRMDAPVLGSEDHLPAATMNWILGGHFLSRLNANLREEKGLTYGSRSYYYDGRTRAHFTVSVDVAASDVTTAATEIMVELARLVKDDVSAEELDAAYRGEVSDWNETRQTAGSATRLYRTALDARLAVDQLQTQVEGRAEVSPEDVRRVAGRHLKPGQPRTWVVVGPRAALESQFEELGWEVTWVTPEQAIRGTF